MESQTSIYSNRKYSYQILDGLSIQLETIENPLNIKIEDLFVMAARRNKKRSFLFVSKVLGKHLPINPTVGLLTGSLLAGQYALKSAGMELGKEMELAEHFKNRKHLVPDPYIPPVLSPVIIGFAETATALGQAFFAAFKKADYFHTTREIISGEEPLIVFEEEHSHATSHRCYISNDVLENGREIVLVDDELSTGKTAINIIRSIQDKFPREKYSVVSILDWRSDQDVQKFKELESELGIKINCVSLVRGNYKVTGKSPELELNADEQNTDIHVPKVNKIVLDNPQVNRKLYGGKLDGIPYDAYSGRFALNEESQSKLNDRILDIAGELAKLRTGKKVLCVGTGEFMYIPMKVAAYMGDNVSYHSTTRSPIHVVNVEEYGARYKLAFPNPEDPEIQHFLYNVAPHLYDEVFVFFERDVPANWLDAMLKEFRKTGIPTINLIFFNSRDGVE
jgi:orotate phosphoribosyltransferase